MANPTLIAQDAAWRGFTFTSLVEAMLATRGLTQDSTTGRTVAIAAEISEVENFARGAFDLLNAEFPSLWSIRTFETNWTSGDHSIALPGNMQSVLRVTLGGFQILPMNREEYILLLRSDKEGGDIQDSGRPEFYRITGFSDEDAGSAEGDRDWRIVLRLHPFPSSDFDTNELVIQYVSLANDFAAGEKGDPIALLPFMQGWVKTMGAILWAADHGDTAQIATQEKILGTYEKPMRKWIEGTREKSTALGWRQPNVTARRRRERDFHGH